MISVEVDEEWGEAVWPLVSGDRVSFHDEGCSGDECCCVEGPLVVYGPTAFA